MAVPYQDIYWFPSGALAVGVEARVFPRHSNTLATLWQDAGETVPQVNPATTDVAGELAFFAAPGDYWIHIGQETFPVSLDGDGVVDDIWPETYQHVQSAASDMWVVNHDMNAFPSVTVLVGGSLVAGADVTYISPNTLAINFTVPLMGEAILRR